MFVVHLYSANMERLTCELGCVGIHDLGDLHLRHLSVSRSLALLSATSMVSCHWLFCRPSGTKERLDLDRDVDQKRRDHRTQCARTP